MSGVFFWAVYLKWWNLRWLHPRCFQVLEMWIWIYSGTPLHAVFYIIIQLLPGTDPIYSIQSMTTLLHTWFNFAFRFLTWGEFGLILLLQQLALVRETHKALVISCFVVLFHQLLEKCVKVRFFCSSFSFFFLLSSIIWYMLRWHQGRCKNYSVFIIKSSVSVRSVYRHRACRSMGMRKGRCAAFSCLQTLDLTAHFTCCSCTVTKPFSLTCAHFIAVQVWTSNK